MRPEDEPKRSRFAWLGTVKGFVSFAGAVLGVIGSVFGILKAIDDRRGVPAFDGALESPDTARRFIDFLVENDRKIVNLDVQCVADASESALHDLSDSWALLRPGGGDPVEQAMEIVAAGDGRSEPRAASRGATSSSAGCSVTPEVQQMYAGWPAVIEVFTADRCPWSPTRSESCPGTYWITAHLGPGADGQVDNGRFGAGNIVMRGEFKVRVRGGRGIMPPVVEHVALESGEVRSDASDVPPVEPPTEGPPPVAPPAAPETGSPTFLRRAALDEIFSFFVVDDDNPTCGDRTDIDPAFPGRVALVGCSLDRASGMDAVDLSLFATRDDVVSYRRGLVADLGGAGHETSWSYDNNVALGSTIEWVASDGRATMVWTFDNRHMVAKASRTDGDQAALNEWWRRHGGRVAAAIYGEVAAGR